MTQTWQLMLGELNPHDIASRVNLAFVRYIWKGFPKFPFHIDSLGHLALFFWTLNDEDTVLKFRMYRPDVANATFLQLPKSDQIEIRLRYLQVMDMHQDLISHINGVRKAWTEEKPTDIGTLRELINFYVIHDPDVAKHLEIVVRAYNELVVLANIPDSEAIVSILNKHRT